MHYDPRSQPHLQPIPIIQQCTGPRPLAWLSSADNEDVVDLSVFTHWQWLAPQSTILTFSAQQSANGERAKTVVNAEQTGWFVWNMATKELEQAVAKSLESPPAGQDAFDYAGVAKAPCISAQCPRIMQSPAHLECKYMSTQRLPGNDSRQFIDLVFAEVVRIHIKDELCSPEGSNELETQLLSDLMLSAEAVV